MNVVIYIALTSILDVNYNLKTMSIDSVFFFAECKCFIYTTLIKYMFQTMNTFENLVPLFDIMASVTSLHSWVDKLKESVLSTNRTVSQMHHRFETLKYKGIASKSRSHRNNLIFRGMQEIYKSPALRKDLEENRSRMINTADTFDPLMETDNTGSDTDDSDTELSANDVADAATVTNDLELDTGVLWETAHFMQPQFDYGHQQDVGVSTKRLRK